MVADDKINKEYALDIVKWSANTSKSVRVVVKVRDGSVRPLIPRKESRIGLSVWIQWSPIV